MPTRLRGRGALLLASVVFVVLAAGCYNNNTGDVNIGGKIKFKLPAFPETGSNAVQVFTEMHYQPSFGIQEAPRLAPPADSVPVTGKEPRYTTLEEYQALSMPDRVVQPDGAALGQTLYITNCVVCHGGGLDGNGPIRGFMDRGPFPANLTSDQTKASSDGELFGFISGGGRQGLAARLRGLRSASPMPEFRLMLTEDERWAIVQYLRSRIGR